MEQYKSILLFSHEHHAGLLFCWRVRQGLKREGVILRIRKYVAYFWEIYFQPLFEGEAQHLLLKVDDVLSRKSLGQHQEIEALVKQVVSNDTAPEPAAFHQLADAVNSHIRFEKRELFPHLLRVLGEAELARIGAAKRTATFKDAYPDEFWMKRSVGCACQL
ncbi:hypothetical protein GCM10023188_02380 [Pontibacter saemangeumensis]|uniref:Hemerythrin HHE cation binding domain-containing protein n=1 Tax=Pontibacter saemangeumensis TaxID=1084525 RepID=A0ABP8L871_9BACT